MLIVTLRRSLATAALALSILLAGACGSEGPEQGTTEPASPPTTTEAPAVPPAPEPLPPAPTEETPTTTTTGEPAAPATTEAPAAPPAPEPLPPAPAEETPTTTTDAPPPTTTSSAEAPPPTATSTTEAPPPTTTSTTEAPPPTTTSTTEAPPPTTTTEPAADVTIRITLVDGRIEAERRYEVSLGDTVEVRVASDVAEEVHLHGYDLYLQLEVGAEVALVFEANLPGVWEAELHPSHRELFQLQVS